MEILRIFLHKKNILEEQCSEKCAGWYGGECTEVTDQNLHDP